METMFERLQRSAPVNRATALQLSHAEPEKFRRDVAAIVKLKFTHLGKDGKPASSSLFPAQLRGVLDYYQSAVATECNRLSPTEFGLFPRCTKKWPRSVEAFSIVAGQLFYRVRLRRGSMICTKYGNRLMFLWTFKKDSEYKIFYDGRVIVSKGADHA